MRPAPKRGALATSLWAARSGLWPVPIKKWDKSPIKARWGLEYPSREKLVQLFRQHSGAGVGLALGPAAGIVDFEIDDPATAPVLELPETLGWQSCRGCHRLFLWDKRLDGMPSVVHLGGAELRIGGEGKQLVSVCPPSVGDDRRRRKWHECWEIAQFPSSLLKVIERPKVAPKVAPTIPTGGNRYAEAALRYEAHAVATAKEGTRNTQLNRSAFVLSRFIPLGMLTRDAIETALSEAALSAGLGDREIAATLASAINAGLLRPW